MTEPVLKVKNLKKYFSIKKSFIDTLKGTPQKIVHAVDGINFEIYPQQVFALVGESGCGKSTTGKLIVKLLEPTDGKIYLRGQDVTDIKTKEEVLEYRRKIQMIFQDPFSSLNPRFRIFDVLEEPLLIHGIGETKAEREELIYKALEMVKIIPPEDYIGRNPHMLSGGQRQRVAIARALILNPTFIVADEPVSMLDVSIRAEILELMKDLKEKMGVTYLYITHDLSTARYFADYIAVMYLGRIVEMGPAKVVIDNPIHPYTRALLAAVPEPIPERRNIIKEIPIKGEVPSAANIPPGCRFHPRCLYAEKGLCDTKYPQLVEYEHNHWAECHLIGKY